MSDLVTIHNLSISFPAPHGLIEAVRGVNLSIRKGSVLALVGESGSGKSLTALSIMRLVPPPGRVTSGRIFFEEQNLLTLPEDAMRSVRGQRISMVFQEPMTSLNPVLRIAEQLCEPLIIHRHLSARDAFERGVALLADVGITSPSARMRDYPHQLSGGMRQRVMIAMALACQPTLLIADEPTTALDVTIQAQILELLDTMRKSAALTMLLITHDLGIVAERSDQVAIMYAGQIVESAPTGRLLATPRHPYTRALLASLPQNSRPGTLLPTLSGQPRTGVPNQVGCSFAERCPQAVGDCTAMLQELVEVAPSHSVRCWRSS